MKSETRVSGQNPNLILGAYDYHTKNGFYPTIREIGDGVSIPSTSVVKYNLSKLMDQGYLFIQPGRSRTISLTDSAYHALVVSDTVRHVPMGVHRKLKWEASRLQSQIESLKRIHSRQIEIYRQELELLTGELVNLRMQVKG